MTPQELEAYDAMMADRDRWKANHDNQVEIKRIIAARPDLKERAPMVEKLMAERNRAQAHSIRQHERIKQLESVTAKEMLANLLELVKSGSEAPEDVAEYRHLAGEISAWGAKFADAMRRRDERASRKRKSPENVQEHATLSAGASVNHGVEVETTGEHENRAADRGCCVSSCSESSISFGS